MLILGIESTAHTFGLGIIEVVKNSSKGKILFNEKIQFKDENSGMDLRKVSDFHVANFDSVLNKAKEYLKSIEKSFTDLDLISFSRGPGIGNALKIGALVAKSLGIKYGIKVVGVSHIKAHLEIGKMLTGLKDPMFLYVSGVNTQVIALGEQGGYKIFGETEDIGLGNILDSFARDVGLGFPGGPEIEKLAKGVSVENYIELPFTIKGMNVTFAGLQTRLKQEMDRGAKVEDLCYSLQETVFSILMEVVERAIAYTGKKEFCIVGGVAANRRLDEMAREMCKLRDIKYESFEIQYAMDNGAMIAWQGYIDKKKAVIIKNGVFSLMPRPYITVENLEI